MPFDTGAVDETRDKDLEPRSVTAQDSTTIDPGEATDTLHYGNDQDRENAGNEGIALGVGARVPRNSGTSVGYEAARNNTGFGATASGYQAAQNNTGSNVTASGVRAAQNNTGSNVTASGVRAAQNNTGNGVTASGYHAARNNTASRVTASGFRAAEANTGNRVTASGFRAARNNTGDNVTVTGYRAARGDGLSDPTTMGDDNIGIGENAIRNNQASGLIAIGQDAGINAQTDDQLIITDRNGNRRLEMDLTTGDLRIEGSLTQNASL